jgi:hypothetical protein
LVILILSALNFTDSFIRSQLAPKDHQTCIESLVIKYKLCDLYLKGLAYDSLKLTTVANFKREAAKTTKDVLNAAKALCTAADRYEKTFDEFYQQRLDNNQSTYPATNDCLKKFYFDKKIIDPTKFSIDVPKIMQPIVES